MQTQIQKFAELGKAFRQLRVQVEPEFADSSRQPVNDPEVIEDVRSLLEEEIGELDQITGLTIDDADTFKGQAIQRLTLGKSQVYQFVISPNGMTYKMVNAADMAEFADGEEGWAEIIEFAATKGKGSRVGKKLNCKPGNMQCGGRCQSGSKNCYANMKPEQKEKTQTAAKKARSKTKDKGETFRGVPKKQVDETFDRLQSGEVISYRGANGQVITVQKKPYPLNHYEIKDGKTARTPMLQENEAYNLAADIAANPVKPSTSTDKTSAKSSSSKSVKDYRKVADNLSKDPQTKTILNMLLKRASDKKSGKPQG